MFCTHDHLQVGSSNLHAPRRNWYENVARSERSLWIQHMIVHANGTLAADSVVGRKFLGILRFIPGHLACRLLAEFSCFELVKGLAHALLGSEKPELRTTCRTLLVPGWRENTQVSLDDWRELVWVFTWLPIKRELWQDGLPLLDGQPALFASASYELPKILARFFCFSGEVICQFPDPARDIPLFPACHLLGNKAHHIAIRPTCELLHVVGSLLTRDDTPRCGSYGRKVGGLDNPPDRVICLPEELRPVSLTLVSIA